MLDCPTVRELVIELDGECNQRLGKQNRQISVRSSIRIVVGSLPVCRKVVSFIPKPLR